MKEKKLTNENAAFTNFEGLCLSDSVNAVDLKCKDGDNLGEKGLSLFFQGIQIFLEIKDKGDPQIYICF